MSETSDKAQGLIPVEYNCVIILDPKEKKSKGGIIIPDPTHERSQMAVTTAELVAMGGNAFADWAGTKPAIGDKVIISKYAGQFREADPSDPLRIVKDKEILAIVGDTSRAPAAA